MEPAPLIERGRIMTARRILHVVGLFRAFVARAGIPTRPRGFAPIPAPGRCRVGVRRWPLLVACILFAAAPAWAASPSLPADVPNILDPAVRVHFEAVAMGNLEANPDLPVILFVNTTADQPQLLLLGFDARNGKDTWSLSSDPIILIATFADTASISSVYIDAGFLDRGVASGIFAAVDGATLPALPDLLKRASATGMRTEL